MTVHSIAKGLVAAGALALATSAMADGGPRRGSIKDAPVGPPPFSWTGFYAGINAGYARGEDKYALDNCGGACTGSGFFGAPANVAGINASGSGSLAGKGFIGGGQIGYNIQQGSLVLGAELDFQALDVSAARTTGFVSTTGPTTTTTALESNWLMTARARIGFAMNRSLFYVTGGYALTDANLSQSQAWNTAPTGAGSYGTSKNMQGYAIGAGLEYALTNNWTFRGEYLHVNLRRENASGFVTDTSGTIRQAMSLSSRLDLDIFRAAINYKF